MRIRNVLTIYEENLVRRLLHQAKYIKKYHKKTAQNLRWRSDSKNLLNNYDPYL